MQIGSNIKEIVIVGPSLKMGGIERASCNIANFFSTDGHRVTYIAIFRQEHFFILNSSIRFIEPGEYLNNTKLDLIKTLIWLRKNIISQNPDTVLVFNYFYSALVLLALAFKEVPVFISDRASPNFTWGKHIAIFNYIVYKIFTPTGIIAQTNIAADSKKDFFGKRTKIKVIPNALHNFKLYPSLQRKKQILAVGRLNDFLKGFDRLVEAFAKIYNKEWILVFAGGHIENNSLLKQINILGIDDRVIFLGNILEIDKVYAEAGIFVIPSRSEGFPNALCEAMAAGLPCISFDFVSGPKEIITDGIDGILVKEGDIDMLALKIDYLIENESERIRIGENAKKIQKRLNIEKVGKDYLEFILSKQ